jgi:DNA-binding response OmpR family regulator
MAGRMPAPSKILLVEDHDDIRLAMSTLLKHAGHTVIEACTVAQGISSVNGQDIALLDLFLPDGLSIGVLKHIRKQQHHTRIAIITAEHDHDHLKCLLGPGDAIFTKPLNFAELLEWINHPASPQRDDSKTSVKV